MEKLQLKHYYSNIGCGVIYENTYYRLDGVVRLSNGKIQLICYDILHGAYGIKLPSEKCLLVLLPLSDLTKEIEHNGEKFVPMDILYNEFSQYDCFEFDNINVLNNPYNQIQNLLEWHFDVYGLIEQGLAIDINTLNK